jgi:hypothetical protein
MEGDEIELYVAEHNIVVDIVALVVASVVPVVLVVQPAKIYNHILHKTLHYLDLENHTLDNILPYYTYIYLIFLNIEI